jgi:hypothetical protein
MEKTMPPLVLLLTLGIALAGVWIHSLQARTARRNLISFSCTACAIGCWSAGAFLDSFILAAHLCNGNGAWDLKESVVSRSVDGCQMNLIFFGVSAVVFSALFVATIRQSKSASEQ